MLKKGAIAEQRDELFGRLFAADGPKAFALAAGHDDDETIFGISFSFHELTDLVASASVFTKRLTSSTSFVDFPCSAI